MAMTVRVTVLMHRSSAVVFVVDVIATGLSRSSDGSGTRGVGEQGAHQRREVAARAVSRVYDTVSGVHAIIVSERKVSSAIEGV